MLSLKDMKHDTFKIFNGLQKLKYS